MMPHIAAKLTLAASFMMALASAHGSDDSHSSMPSMTNMDGMTMEDQQPANITYPPTYFAHPEHSGLIYGHIALTVIAWVFFLPVAVVLSLTRSRFTLAMQSLFLVLNGLSVFLAVLYNAKTPDLYPNNAHHKIGWIITLVVCAHVFVSFIGRAASALAARRARSSSQPAESLAFLNSSSQNFENGFQRYGHARHSDESFEAASPTAHSFRTSSASTAFDESAHASQERFKEYDNEEHDESTPTGLPGLATGARKRKFVRIWKSIFIMYNIVDRIILPFGFIALTTGIITFARFFEGHEVFSGLAHWIKGGVFFWLGLFNLGRWSGCFAEIGWAWNRRPRYRQSKTRWTPTAEFVESALILFYGSTNIFLEHLGNAGGAWSSQDLEHMSITILFIGGGLCGMLIESHSVRQLLNMNLEINAGEQNRNLDNEERELNPPDTYNLSLNPIPALVILLLGMMMSSHQQSTMISSMVHKQWGNLLLGASVARGLTYVLLYLRPPSSVMPSRPPTELLSSFGLIAGGIIFMASSSDTIEGMIHYNLDAMFFYTVSMGSVAMLMAWELMVLAIKGLSARSERRRSNVPGK